MEQILYNAQIRTLDDQGTIAEAVGIKDGKVAFIGTNEEALRIECEEKLDLQGKLLLPGFVDTHLHMLNYAFVENSVKLFDCTSLEEMLDKVRQRIEDSKDNPPAWLYCRGWNEEHFANPCYPHKTKLDEISSTIPIIMVRVCGHVAVCNSCGLERLKKIKEYPELVHNVNTETGLIKENAVQFYYSTLNEPSREDVKKYMRYSIRKLNEAGFTGIQSDDLASLPGKNWRNVIEAYRELDIDHELTLRVYEQCLFERVEDAKAFIDEGYRTGQKGEYFTIGPMKLLQDGSLGARTAALNEPYEGEKENKGITLFSQGELNDLLEYFDKHQMQAAIHCIGDRAMDMVIQAIASSSYRDENAKNRHGIVHAQITNPSVLQAMQKHNIMAYIQPVFVDLDMGIVEQQIGKHRMNKVYAWKSMLDMGIPVMGGSDAPVVSFNVMENIYFAVTRKNIQGQPEGGWLPTEKMSVDEAVKLFTKNAAYASYSECENGTIEIGKNADFVILERNIYEIHPNLIKDTKIDMTIVGGKIVYKRY